MEGLTDEQLKDLMLLSDLASLMFRLRQEQEELLAQYHHDLMQIATELEGHQQ